MEIPLISDIGWSEDIESLGRTLNGCYDSIVSKQLHNPKLLRLSRLARETAYSFLLGLGTRIDEGLALEWFHISACGGDSHSMFLLTSLEKSTLRPSNEPIPRRLLGALAANIGYRRATEILWEVDAVLASTAVESYRLRNWGRSEPQTIRLALNHDQFLLGIKNGIYAVGSHIPVLPSAQDWKESALHIYAAVGDIQTVRYLVLEAGANVNLENFRRETPIFYALRCNRCDIAKFLLEQGAAISHISTEKCTLLHALSCVDDEMASELAPCFDSTAADLLNVNCSEVSYTFQESYFRGKGIPLFWAALRMRTKLFKKLFVQHQKFDIQVDVMKLVSFLAKRHLFEMLEFVLVEYGRLGERERQPPIRTENNHAILEKPNLANGPSNLESVPDEGSRLGSRLATLSLENPKVLLTEHDYTDLLCEALDVSYSLNVCRRYLHGSNFRYAKTTTLKLLLSRGANPLGRSGTTHDINFIPLSIMIYTGDDLSLSLVLEHFKVNSVEPLPHLSNDVLFGGMNALARSICVDSRENFLLLLENYPSLMSLVEEDGINALHAAAAQEWTGYTIELLNRGADRYCGTSDGFTPFFFSLMVNPRLEVAKVLAKDADMGLILGPDNQSGYTAFAKLLDRMTSSKEDIPINRLVYLVEEYGKPEFLERGTNVFHAIVLRNTPPTNRAQIALEEAILKYLIEIFAEKVDFIDYSGRAPLHHAVEHCNISAVKILLDHKASVNIEIKNMGPDSPWWRIHGYTPLDIAIEIKKRGPDEDTLQGGAREIEHWQRNIRRIINLLLVNGGKSGSGWAVPDHYISVRTINNAVMLSSSQHSISSRLA